MAPFTVINPDPRIPILANVPHASAVIPKEYRDQFLLTDQEIATEHAAIVDWFTDELYSPIAELGGTMLIAGVSRLLVDTERFMDDDKEVMAQRGVGVIYERTTKRAQLRREITVAERKKLLEHHYIPYHAEMTRLANAILRKFGRCLILDCHSFPANVLPYELTSDALRPEICFGTDSIHSPEGLLTKLEASVTTRGWSQARNSPFAGTVVPLSLYGDRRISSVMLEINRAMYMDERTTTRLPGFTAVQGWVEEVVRTAAAYLSHSSIRLGDLFLEPLTEAHFPLLHRWLNTPHVMSQWDGACTLQEVQTKYGGKISSDSLHAYIVSQNSVPFGYIQVYRAAKSGNGWWANEPLSTVGIDQFIGEAEFLGKGLGTALVQKFSDWLLQQPNNARVITDPKPDNTRAIQCYRNAGFIEVGLTQTPDGAVLLMEKRRG